MIAATYSISAVLLAITGWLFAHDQLTATTQTVLWTVIFFFASAASSSAYLTVSEVFPIEMRGMAIALFYALGTGMGGTAAPGLFGRLIDGGLPVQRCLRLPVRFELARGGGGRDVDLRGQGRGEASLESVTTRSRRSSRRRVNPGRPAWP